MGTHEVTAAGATFVVEASAELHVAFWERFAAGRYEPATVAVLTRALRAGDTFVDVGAWIGPFTLLAAALGAEVVAFEPDPLALAALRANLALNEGLASRVALEPAALAGRDG
ncbi:MAG: FkbM family methyltransferase, partial [Acidimicrobiales bacterium]